MTKNSLRLSGLVEAFPSIFSVYNRISNVSTRVLLKLDFEDPRSAVIYQN